MTSGTGPHEEFEIAALRRARGALDAGSSARLAAHLAACAACRGFAATAEATEAALRGRADEANVGRDWRNVRAGLRGLVGARRRQGLRVTVALTAIAAISWWSLGWVFGVCVVAFAVVMLVVQQLPLRRLDRLTRKLESSDADLLALYRDELDKEINGLRKQRPYGPLLLIVFGLNVIVATFGLVTNHVPDRPLSESRHQLGTIAIMLISMALTVGPTWRRARVVLPQLERERRDLWK